MTAIPAFTQEELIRGLDRLHDPRMITLKLLYSVPGYAGADLETKNAIYDMAIKAVASIEKKEV